MADELLVKHDGYICTLTINRPEKRNALNYEVLSGLSNSLASLASEGKTRAIILTGAGDQAFSAGMDLGFVNSERARADKILDEALDSVLKCPIPVIARIQADALGAGCDLTSTCDFRIASDNARMGIPPVKFGWVYYPKSIQRMINLIGVANTKELFLTARFVPAARAKEMGLLNYMVSPASLDETVSTLAQEIAEKAPLAVRGTKYVISQLFAYQQLDSRVEEEIDQLIKRCYQSEDAIEGNRAFKEKRKPDFKGR
jgi:enoyl-CoA hydratase